jgi:hypothetical protein
MKKVLKARKRLLYKCATCGALLNKKELIFKCFILGVAKHYKLCEKCSRELVNKEHEIGNKCCILNLATNSFPKVLLFYKPENALRL